MPILQSKLAQRHKPVADDIFVLMREGKGLGATEGMQRLELMCEQYDELSPNTAYIWIDPGAIQNEIEDAQLHTRKMGFIHFVRNCLSLLPLILTWAALFTAVNSYQEYLTTHTNDKDPIPFLQLWQNGFGGITHFTFTVAAGTDVILLSLYLIFVVWTQRMEQNAHTRAVKFVSKLQVKINDLLKYISADSIHVGDQSDIERVINGVKQVVDAATASMKQVVEGIAKENKQTTAQLEQSLKTVVTDAQDSMKKATDSSTSAITASNNKVESLFNQQIVPMMTTFHTDMGALHTELGNYQGRLNDLTNASQQLASASQQLTTASATLTDNAERYVTIGQDISTQIAALNVTQNDVMLQIEAIANGITTAAGNMTTATTNMETAAKSVANVAGQLDKGMHTTITTMTNNVHESTKALAQVGPQLEQASTYLYHTLQAFSSLQSPQSPPLGFVGRIRRRFRKKSSQQKVQSA